MPSITPSLERMLTASDTEGRAPAVVVRQLSGRVRAVARAHRLDSHDVDDVVQTAWLRLLEHHHQIRDPAAVCAWLQTTARRESLRVLRDRARVAPLEEEAMPLCDGAPGVQSRLEADERRAILADAIQALPARQRQLMAALLADEEPSYDELARTLRMPIGSIGPTRQRSFERLRRDARLAGVAGSD
jgi:RNA polymerase sigma factor (sigma-70 family)